MIGGTNSVATMPANTSRLPRNSIRARAYAAGAAVSSTSSALPSAAIIELKNQRMTGVCDDVLKIVSNASRDHSLGSSVGGTSADSSSVLNAVKSIQAMGAT